MTGADKLLSAGKDQLLSDIAKLMKQRDISQVPVIENGTCIGSINSEIFLSVAVGGKEKVSDVMEEPFPQVSVKTSQKAIAELLKTSPAVIVTDKGKIAGIISKDDFIGLMG